MPLLLPSFVGRASRALMHLLRPCLFRNVSFITLHVPNSTMTFFHRPLLLVPFWKTDRGMTGKISQGCFSIPPFYCQTEKRGKRTLSLHCNCYFSWKIKSKCLQPMWVRAQGLKDQLFFDGIQLCKTKQTRVKKF